MKNSQCQFDKAWIGKCDNPTTEGSKYCKEHTDLKCCSCGKQATRECSETMQFVCGFPLCDDCEHTIRSNGCSSGGDLLKDLKGHCKKTEQVYQPWYKE